MRQQCGIWVSFAAAEKPVNHKIRAANPTNLTGSDPSFIRPLHAVLPYYYANKGRAAPSFRYRQRAARSPIQAQPLSSPTKWGIEGFVQSVRRKLAPLVLIFVIAEPGPTATHLCPEATGSPHSRRQPYEDTPAGETGVGHWHSGDLAH